MTMPGYAVPDDAIVDVGVIAVGGVVAAWAATEGGLTWDPGKKVRHVEYDGRSFEHANLLRVTGYDSKLSGKIKRGFTLDFEPGSESDGSSGSDGNQVTLLEARLPWEEGDCLTDVYYIGQQQDQVIFRIYMPLAYVKTYKMVTKDNDEATWDIEIVPVKSAESATSDPYSPPFTYQLVSPA
jgi:hypothetical protein